MAQYETETHYTATVRAERVERTIPPEGRGNRVRNVTEVANVVIRAKTLESLKIKVTAHVALVDED